MIAPGVKPEHLNDDKLGRTLDKLFDADLTKVFVSCAMKAALRYGLEPGRSSMHLDSTSGFHLHGDYETEREEDHPEAAISITHGYSRDQRPDLKQFIVDLIVSVETVTCPCSAGSPNWATRPTRPFSPASSKISAPRWISTRS